MTHLELQEDIMEINNMFRDEHTLILYSVPTTLRDLIRRNEIYRPCIILFLQKTGSEENPLCFRARPTIEATLEDFGTKRLPFLYQDIPVFYEWVMPRDPCNPEDPPATLYDLSERRNFLRRR